MNNFQIIVISICLVVAAISIYAKLRFDYPKKLTDILYEDKNPKEYLERLEKPKTKLFISKKNIEIMKLNVYQMVDDIDNIFKQYEIIDKIKLNPSERLNYNSMKLYYYIRAGKLNDCKKIISEIEKDSSKVNTSESMSIYQESNILYRLNVEHDVSLKEELLGIIKDTKDKNIKFTSYMRLAKLSYLNNDTKDIDRYLELAKHNCEDKQKQSVINSCIKKHDLLKNI